jgi:hydrogenase-4 membrane subunit HyfE
LNFEISGKADGNMDEFEEKPSSDLEPLTFLDESKSLWKLISGSAILASMCCLPSIVLILFGLASVSSAAAVSDTLYWGLDGYQWFRPALSLLSVILVISGLVIYFRSRGICSIEQVKRERKRIINISLTVLITSYLLYLVFNYVILTEIGIALGLPWQDSRFWTK